jgi:hypothetical protein
MRAAICGAVMALTVTAAVAGEDFNSVNSILPGCKKGVVSAAADFDQSVMDGPIMVFKHGRCMGTVEGIVFLLKGASMARQSRITCTAIPETATLKQIMNVVVTYIETRPNRMHESFKGLAVEALQDAWPCRE